MELQTALNDEANHLNYTQNIALKFSADPAVMADHRKMAETGRKVTDAQNAVDALYQRWDELQSKRGDS